MAQTNMECSVLAFYGLNVTGESKEQFFRAGTTWFEELDHPANFASIHGSGFPGKPRTLDLYKKRIQQTGLRKVESIELYNLPPGKTHFIGSSVVQGYLNARENGFVILEVRSFISRLPSNPLAQIARKMATIFSPAYGIGYRRDATRGASMYAHGVGIYRKDQTPEDKEEDEEICHWYYLGVRDLRIYLRGEVRDVYPWNFLTAPQFTAPVGKLSLEQWIRKDAKRGKLTPLTDKMLLWEVEDKHIPAVREVLWEAGRIFDYHKYIEPPDPDWTPEDSLREVIGDMPPEDLIVLDGTGKEIPTSEIKKIVKRGKKKR